ncbi:MAG: porin [Planctomycetaceae bacterium]|nr:porin [Planctomycetaceae bacterium]
MQVFGQDDFVIASASAVSAPRTLLATTDSHNFVALQKISDLPQNDASQNANQNRSQNSDIPQSVSKEQVASHSLSACDAAASSDEPDCYSSPIAENSSFQLFRGGSRLKLSGWVEAGFYTNARGAKSAYDPNDGGMLENSGNGPIYGIGRRTTNFNANQILARIVREMDCKNTFDWGFQADFVYGMMGTELQSYGDETFDYGWGGGVERDYSLAMYQLYGEIGYKKLTARYGKFGSPIGYAPIESWDKFFYTDPYAYNLTPGTHTGVLLRYQLTDDLTLTAGWTAGLETGFANKYGDDAIIAGLELTLTENAIFNYCMTRGRRCNDISNRLANGGGDDDFFIHSLYYDWNISEKWEYVLDSTLVNLNERGGLRYSAYGIGNHLFYSLDDADRWKIGFRAEWIRDAGILGYADGVGVKNNSDYVELTLGLNFNPTEHLRIRPELRYDCSYKNAIFNNGTKREQLSGGFAVLYGF